MSQNFKSTYQDYSGYTCISKSISIPCINTCTIHITKCNFSWNAFEIHISEFELKPKFASIIYVHLFYKYFIQLCILTFETILFSFNKKIDSEGILLKNSGVLQSWSISCQAEFWFSISMRYWTIWPLTHGKQKVADAVGFLWWSDMQTVPPKMLLEIYTTNVYTLGFWIFFFSNLLSYCFQKAIDFCDWYIALMDRVKRVH